MGDSTLSKEDEYRRHAAETMELASRASSTKDKGRLLAITEAWLDLADRAQRVAAQHKRKDQEIHSLLRSKVTGERPDPE
jgi:hypothetical protein